MDEKTPVGLGEMLRVSLAVLLAGDPRGALGELVRALLREMSLRAAIVRMLGDDDERTLGAVSAAGLSEAYLAKGPVNVVAGSLDARVLRGEVVELSDVTTDPAFQYPEQARREGLRTMLAVPIRIYGEPRGVLRAYRSTSGRFGDDERAVLTALATLAGAAFEKARVTAAMEAIQRDLASTLDIRQVVNRLLKHAVGGLGFSAASLRILDEDGALELVGSRHLSRRYLEAGRRSASTEADRRVLQGETVAVADLHSDPALPYTEEALAEGLRSVLSVPLVVTAAGGARVLGLLRVYSRRVRHFDARDLRFVRLVADLGALAIDNARLHRRLEERVEALDHEAAGWYRFLVLS